MTDKDKIASIPEPPKTADPAMRSFMLAMKEALEVRLGRRGDPLEEGVTKRDLVKAGIARLKGPHKRDLEPVAVEQPVNNVVPPAPAAASAVGVYGGIALGWDSPFSQYPVHAYVEIWRSDQPDPTTRVLLDSSRGTSYFDRITDKGEVTYYYWLVSVSEFGRRGAFSPMLTGGKPADIDTVLEELNGRLDLSMLNAAFQADYQGMRDAVNSTSQTLASVSGTVTSLTGTVDGLSGTVGDLNAAVGSQGQTLTNLSATVTQQAGVTSSYAASWSLTLNSNGYVSGLASYNNGSKAEFAIVSDVFWIATPGSTNKVRPFVVENGTVYMNTAVIKDASISEAKIGNVSIGKIRDANGNPIMQVSGKLRADLIDVGTIQVGNANISGIIQSNAVGSNGQPRWVLDKNGGLSLNSVGGSGRMEVRDSVIKCYDASNRLRLHIGNLQA